MRPLCSPLLVGLAMRARKPKNPTNFVSSCPPLTLLEYDRILGRDNQRLFYQYGLLSPPAPRVTSARAWGKPSRAGAVGLIALNMTIENYTRYNQPPQ